MARAEKPIKRKGRTMKPTILPEFRQIVKVAWRSPEGAPLGERDQMRISINLEGVKRILKFAGLLASESDPGYRYSDRAKLSLTWHSEIEALVRDEDGRMIPASGLEGDGDPSFNVFRDSITPRLSWGEYGEVNGEDIEITELIDWAETSIGLYKEDIPPKDLTDCLEILTANAD